MLVFEERGKPEAPGEKPLGTEQRTNKLTPHMTPGPGITSFYGQSYRPQ